MEMQIDDLNNGRCDAEMDGRITEIVMIDSRTVMKAKILEFDENTQWYM